MKVQALINEGFELLGSKKFDEAIEKLNQALDGIEDKSSQIQWQDRIQFLLGRCYLEQAQKAKGKASEQLFEQAIEHFQQRLRLIKRLRDEDGIQKQCSTESLLGGCYFEQAMRAEGKVAATLFVQAVEHFQQWLSLAKQLKDKNSIQKALSWLGRCYLEQAMKAEGGNSERLFENAIEQFKEKLRLAEQLGDDNGTQKQINALSWLGRCYLEQAMKAEGGGSERLFENAIEQFQEGLRLVEQLGDENSIQKQIIALYWLGRCYLEQAISIKDKKTSQAKILFKQAEGYFSSVDKRLSQLIDKSEREKLKKRINELLRESYFLQEKWQHYFDLKKKGIREKLFENIENKKDNLTDAISTILAVLNIPPLELREIPLAHYTSPSVCERLFGIVSDKTNDKTDDNYPVDNSKVSPMRIGSSTYMNDPTEGEGLLELLNLQDLELENKADCPVYNAFFTCFSSRVNDLNQFRLYGKENGVEASGCCLVFNKSEDWLKDPDISASFGSFTNKLNEDFEESVEADGADSEDENLPLYQVAYIAYQDEYVAKEKCSIWLQNKNNSKFGIRLKYFGNKGWHECRIGKLEEALKQLIKIFKGKAKIDDEDRKALEYIRYLFKDFAFRDEEEFRLLKIEQIGSDKIEYCEATKSIYLPYADVRDIVDEVILGTNYEKSGNHRKAEVFQHLMRKYYPNVKVSRSSLPINANPPIKKD
ncbi:sel1 repeat family protein [Neisseria sp. 27098_8_158]|uniref:sel1 repeat family protein n=1 Tax=Neisseria sp. 27098_8_158 TaxID=3003680 RepID=UPI00352F25F5